MLSEGVAPCSSPKTVFFPGVDTYWVGQAAQHMLPVDLEIHL